MKRHNKMVHVNDYLYIAICFAAGYGMGTFMTSLIKSDACCKAYNPTHPKSNFPIYKPINI